jgi:SEC-C motif domain protein
MSKAKRRITSAYTSSEILRHDTQPARVAPAIWLSPDVKRHRLSDVSRTIVEFVARYKINGLAHCLHEVSNFVREAGRWFHVDGNIT